METKTIELTWDRTTGPAPKQGEVIRNFFGEKYKVIAKKGNEITLQPIS